MHRSFSLDASNLAHFPFLDFEEETIFYFIFYFCERTFLGFQR